MLTPTQVREWATAGAVLVSGVWPAALIDGVVASAAALLMKGRGFGSGGALAFPSASAAANAVTLHPRILRAAAQLLGTDDIRLTQSDVWRKDGISDAAWAARGKFDNYDQRIHVDYPNHTLVHPPEWDRPDVVSCIVYYCDWRDCGGETAVVPRSGPGDPLYAWPLVRTPGVDSPWVNDRVIAERRIEERGDAALIAFRRELYRRDVPARYTKGSVLLYRQDVWHRGTPVRAARVAQNLSFRRAGSEWVGNWHPGWAQRNYLLGHPRRELEGLVAALNPAQRAALGFPAPGSPYWTPATLLAVKARYASFPAFDWRPYEDAVRADGRAGRAARL